MRRRAWIISALASWTSWALADPDPQAQARQSADQWLALVDAGRHLESWQAAGALFRSAVSAQAWAQAVGAVRGPLGALQRRQVLSAQPTRTLPAAPDGQYVVFRFEASFAHKAVAVETVTTVLESDGAWRVVGYFVR